MKRRMLTCAAFSAFMCVSLHVFAQQEDEGREPNASFGVAGTASYYNGWQFNSGYLFSRTRFTPGYGGGFIFEKMFNNYVGIQSGLRANYYSLKMSLKTRITFFSLDDFTALPLHLTLDGWSVSVPLSLLTSINISFFSLNLLAGIAYTHIIVSSFQSHTPAISMWRTLDLLPFINQPQFVFTAGLLLRFRIARFIDLFVGGGGELCVTSLSSSYDGLMRLYSLNATAGVMFRTNIFPAPKK